MRQWLPFTETEIEASIIARWHQIVEHFPEEIAVTTVCGEQYSYAALDQASNALAQALLTQLGPENCPVILLLGHSPAMITSIIATLKANKAYVAFDPTQAPGQLQLLSEATAAALIVTDHEHHALAQAAAAAQEQIWLLETVPATDQCCPAISITPDAIAGIFFTSGTISQPKGVPRSHRTILHRIWFSSNLLHFAPGHRISGIRQCGLGGGVADLFNALLNGATYCIYPLQTRGLHDLSDWLQQQKITYFHPPIVLFRQWLDLLAPDLQFPHLRQILPSGRKNSTDLARLWPHVADECVVLTSYSATETTEITCTVLDRFTPTPEGILHVGEPLPGKQVLVMRADGSPAAVNEVGEIVVRSRYISTGYWRQPELTAQRFRPATDGSGEICYFTGDWGRRRSDDYVELVGRQDSQVKLRGYRVVLSEVEDALQALPSVKQAVVTADEERGLLLAYLIAAQTPPASPATIRAALAETFPYYALPTHITYLPHFPLLSSGKINRHSLPLPQQNRPDLGTPLIPPRNEQEAQLVAFWEDLLAVHPIGIQDNFFDLGGHSIAAMRLLHQIEQQFQQPLVLQDFIFQPTIAHLATLLSKPSANATVVAQSVAAPAMQVQDITAGTARHALANHEQLRLIYESLEDKSRIRQLRNKLMPKQLQSRRLQLLLCLPQPVALSLLHGLIQQRWVQARYFSAKSALVQQFLAELEQAPTADNVVARCLFYDYLSQARLRGAIFRRIPKGTIPVEGLPMLAHARAQRQGVILLSSHRYQAPYFRSLQLNRSVIGNMETLVNSLNADQTMSEHILYSRQLELARQTLQQGGAIAIAPDVNRGHGTQIALPFHGRMHGFRTSFAELALLTDAQIFFVASDLQAYNRFSFRLIGPFDRGSTTMSHEERVQQLMLQYVTHLRRQWAENPWALPWWLMKEHLAYGPVGDAR